MADRLTAAALIAAGQAWAEREADAVIDWTRVDPEWTATWHDALPLVEGTDSDEREEDARIVRQAASKRWDELRDEQAVDDDDDAADEVQS